MQEGSHHPGEQEERPGRIATVLGPAAASYSLGQPIQDHLAIMAIEEEQGKSARRTPTRLRGQWAE